MNVRKAYEKRETLDDAALERLEAALQNEVETYTQAIANYPPDRMEKFGQPHLADLKARVENVQILRASRVKT